VLNLRVIPRGHSFHYNFSSTFRSSMRAAGVRRCPPSAAPAAPVTLLSSFHKPCDIRGTRSASYGDGGSEVWLLILATGTFLGAFIRLFALGKRLKAGADHMINPFAHQRSKRRPSHADWGPLCCWRSDSRPKLRTKKKKCANGRALGVGGHPDLFR